MSVFRAQISVQLDTALPRDAITMNPHFFGTDASALASALKANILSLGLIGNNVPFSVKLYDAQKAPPNLPLATASQAGTGPLVTAVPREVALCLSFYSTYNRPRYRGRIYVPATMLGGATSLRPTGAQITQCMKWADAFKSGLPAAHNWVVFSPTDNVSRGVSNYFVDDEWDTVRSRGLRSTTRQVGVA